MAIEKRSKNRREIDLGGPQGNAFCLMGMAKEFCKQLERDHKPIIEEMMSGDYENLLKVFDREFGSFVTLIRADPDEDEEQEGDDEDCG